MDNNTTVTTGAVAGAGATLLVTILALCGVDLGGDATVAVLTGSATTVLTAVLGLLLPRSK